MADKRRLLQPFQAKDSALESSGSSSGILLRLLTLIVVGVISLWANHEASKGFTITIINESKDSSPSGKRFALFFESDDTAARILLDTSFFVERFLYGDVPNRLGKRVNRVTVVFDGSNTQRFSVTSGASHGEYVIRISSFSMDRSAVESALRRSMVRIWIWGEESTVSPELVAGVVEYLAVECRARRRFNEDKEEEDVNLVARWLGYCERQSKGFIQRLNYGMRRRLDDRTVVALASKGACGSVEDVLREIKGKDNRSMIERRT